MKRVLLFVVALQSVVWAQSEKVEVEPVTCWWRTSTAAVRVGEPFDVVLTCSLLQTEAARAVADESRLDPSVVQFPPFELVSGARGQDLTTATRRFVQFEYRLRAIAENVFATEATVPPLEISYRVESRVSGGETLAGRDLTYVLPPLTMRVLSLVPDIAEDIREAPIATVAEIERGAARATMYRVAAAVAFALGAALLVIAIASAMRGRRAAGRVAARALPASAVLTAVRRELAAVQEAVRASGWTDDLAARGHAAVRIVAAYAAGKGVTQRTMADGSSAPAGGELAIERRTGPSVTVSASVAALDDGDLRDALARFGAARYGRERIDAGLDDALATASRRADQLIAARPWTERVWPR